MACLMTNSVKLYASEVNLKPEYLQVTRQEAEDCAVCEIERNRRVTHEENEEKKQSSVLENYCIIALAFFTFGMAVDHYAQK